MRTTVDRSVCITVVMSEEELVVILAALGNFSDVSWKALVESLHKSNSEIIPIGASNDVYQTLWNALQEARG